MRKLPYGSGLDHLTADADVVEQHPLRPREIRLAALAHGLLDQIADRQRIAVEVPADRVRREFRWTVDGVVEAVHASRVDVVVMSSGLPGDSSPPLICSRSLLRIFARGSPGFCQRPRAPAARACTCRPSRAARTASTRCSCPSTSSRAACLCRRLRVALGDDVSLVDDDEAGGERGGIGECGVDGRVEPGFVDFRRQRRRSSRSPIGHAWVIASGSVVFTGTGVNAMSFPPVPAG